MRQGLWRAGCLASFAALAIGCGGEAGVDVHPVTGKVTKGGQPLAGVLVTFTPVASNDPKAPGVSSSGLTNASGEFVLITQSGKAGAVAGKHKVQLTVPEKADGTGGDWADPSYRDKMMKQRDTSVAGGSQGAPAAAETSDLVPSEYADGEKTPLTYEVKPGSNSFEIPLP
jgi:hypothetical protein